MAEAQKLQGGQTVKARWVKLDGERREILERARACSALTIPSLLPPDGSTGKDNLPTPYQSLGARGVNNLAAKLYLALLPPNSPFFRLAVDDATYLKIAKTPQDKTMVEVGLNKIERSVAQAIETQKIRVPAFEALKHLVCCGNALIYLPDAGGAKTYRLDQYVVKRSPMGEAIEIIVLEKVNPSVLPPEIQSAVASEGKEINPDEQVEIYTHVQLVDGQWVVCQEALEKVIPGTEGTYPFDACPWLALRWTAVAGEDYGRGLVEEYRGDLISLEALTQAIIEGSAAAAKIVFLIDPNGTTRANKLSKSRSGDFIEGRAQDVTTLQLEKYNDFRVALETIQEITQRLSQAFLLNSSIQRNGERVTATEISYMATELEDALGGVYSVLAQELQMAMVQRLMVTLTKQKLLPVLPKGLVKPLITTGLEALRRSHDVQNLTQFAQGISAALGPDVLKTYLRVDGFINKFGMGLGLDLEGLIKTDEEVQRAAAQQQQAQMGMELAKTGAATQIAKGMVEQNGGRDTSEPGA